MWSVKTGGNQDKYVLALKRRMLFVIASLSILSFSTFSHAKA